MQTRSRTKESKQAGKTKFTVYKLSFVDGNGDESNYFWINQENNARLLEAVADWAAKYFHGNRIEWEHTFQEDVESTPEEIRVMHNTPMTNDCHHCIMGQVKSIPQPPEDVMECEDDMPEWVIKTLSDL